MAGRQLQWRLGDLGARQHRPIEVSFRAERPGSVTNCCEVTAAGGLKVSDCVTTTITAAGASAPPSGPTTPGASPLDVRVVAPAQATVGDRVTFEIDVTNRGQTLVTNPQLKVRFDPGLEHADAPGYNVINKSLGNLSPGERKLVAATFRVTKPGKLSVSVEISGPGIATATAQGYVMATGGAAPPGPGAGGGLPPPGGPERPRPEPAAPPSLSVTKTGPTRHVVDESAHFTIEVKNTGAAPLRNVKVVDSYDAALKPTDATEGFHLEGFNLVWTIDVPAGKSSKLEVLCLCQSAAPKACNRVTVTTADGGLANAEACLEIVASNPPPAAKPSPPPATDNLKLSVVGTTYPVTAGRELTYVITVTNGGSASYRQVSVTATVPEGMVPNPLGTTGPEGTTSSPDGQVIRFRPVAELPPNGSLTYHVRVLAKQPGKSYRFRAEVNADGLPQPVWKEENTEVSEKRG